MNRFLLPSFFLSLFGLFNILGINQSLFVNQVLFIIIGFIAFFIVKKIGRNFFTSNVFSFYWLFVSILVATFIIGFEVRGSRRWIDLYFFNFQGSEFFKAFFILFFADFLSQKERLKAPVKTFFVSLLFVAIPIVIIFKQPDLGNAMVFLFIYFVMLLFSYIPKKYFFYTLLVSVLIVPVGWNFLKEYQKDRIVTFMKPQVDPEGTAYNMTQSIITSGSGKFLGKGLGLGTQSKLLFLPENHTDFAFSSLVEQFGFLGGASVIILFMFLTFQVFKRIMEHFGKKDIEEQRNFLFLVGFLAYFVFQVFVNIGMNLGLLPITGIALPFISYGGSSLVAFMIGIALLP